MAWYSNKIYLFIHSFVRSFIFLLFFVVVLFHKVFQVYQVIVVSKVQLDDLVSLVLLAKKEIVVNMVTKENAYVQ